MFLASIDCWFSRQTVINDAGFVPVSRRRQPLPPPPVPQLKIVPVEPVVACRIGNISVHVDSRCESNMAAGVAQPCMR